MTLTAMDVSSLQWQEMVRNHFFAKYDLSTVRLLAVGVESGVRLTPLSICAESDISNVCRIRFIIIKAIRTAFSNAPDLSLLWLIH